jgi:carboxy-terminal domain RNA polymerase II polypeptide A small phosphatase
MGLLT